MTNVGFAALIGEAATWQPMDSYSQDDCLFNANQVLHAFEQGMQKGFDHGMTSLEQAIVKLQKQNQAKVAKQCEVVLDFLRQRNLHPVHVYLQTVDWNEMNVIMLVEEESFLKEEFDNVYDLTYSIETSEAECDLNLSFSFAPNSPSFDRVCLNADGYTLRLKQLDTARAQHVSK